MKTFLVLFIALAATLESHSQLIKIDPPSVGLQTPTLGDVADAAKGSAGRAFGGSATPSGMVRNIVNDAKNLGTQIKRASNDFSADTKGAVGDGVKAAKEFGRVVSRETKQGGRDGSQAAKSFGRQIKRANDVNLDSLDKDFGFRTPKFFRYRAEAESWNGTWGDQGAAIYAGREHMKTPEGADQPHWWRRSRREYKNSETPQEGALEATDVTGPITVEPAEEPKPLPPADDSNQTKRPPLGKLIEITVVNSSPLVDTHWLIKDANNNDNVVFDRVMGPKEAVRIPIYTSGSGVYGTIIYKHGGQSTGTRKSLIAAGETVSLY